MKTFFYTFLSLILSISMSAQTVVDVIVDSDDHNTLEAAVIAADLAETLSGDGPFTVFAPTDAAFAALPEGTVETLLEDPSGALTDILLYHVIGAQVNSGDLSDGQVATTLNGSDVTVTINDDGVFINNALVTVVDLPATNGVVHVLDAVLLPPTNTITDIVVASPVHETLEAAVIAAGLAETLASEGPFTVFAPTDDAFAALPEGTVETLLEDPMGDLADILLYHAVSGTALSTDLSDGMMIETINGKNVTVTINDDGVFINDAQVTMADIPADNGVVHVIDAVLLPPSNTITDIVVASPVHETLEAAVIAAGLAETLASEGPFTVFAPTDDAFAALPEGTVETLLEDPMGDLADILLYHAVSGTALSTDLSDGMMIETINGKNVTVTINDDGVFINDAQVTMADIPADNGVVHVINAVLLPPRVTVVDVIVNSPDHNTLETAVVAADLAETLSGDGPFTVFAPTDDAFAELPQEAIDALLANPGATLSDILRHHVLSGTVLSSDLVDGTTATTLQGEEIFITINDDGVFINDAQVTMADIETDNGVVHVIDAVLLPSIPTTVEFIVDSPIHETLEAAVIAAGLTGALDDLDVSTVFAPTDAAFAALPEGVLETLLEDPAGDLTQILLYHVIAAPVPSTSLTDGMTATTVNGKDVAVTINDEGIFINDAQVIVNDILTLDGIVHVIDAVLLPPRVTVVDVIVNSEDHNTLEAAVLAADLAGTLSGDGPFTVFAPTDDAFAALPEGTVETLLEDPSGDLTDILLNHVASGAVLSTDLSDQQIVTTLNDGEPVIVSIQNGNVMINDAMVTMADVTTDNGVVHVIDAVLLPGFVSTFDPAVFANVTLSPNPAVNMITLDMKDVEADVTRLELFDAQGRRLNTYQSTGARQDINISDLQSGLYFLNIVMDDMSYSKKFYINK